MEVLSTSVDKIVVALRNDVVTTFYEVAELQSALQRENRYIETIDT